MNEQTVAVQSRSATVQDYLSSRRDGLMALVPKHLDGERFLKVALAHVVKSEKLLQCTPESLLSSVMEAAQCGLEIGIFNQCWLVPRNNSYKENGQWKKRMEAGLQIGYGGLITVAKNGGELAAVNGAVVRENDEYYRDQDGLTHRWQPFDSEEKRGPIVGAWIRLTLTNGEEQYTDLSVEKLDRLRKLSQFNGKDTPAWRDYPEEMYLKCTLRNALKRVKLSTAAMNAIARDDEVSGIVKVDQVREVPKLGNDAVLGMLEGESDRSRGEGAPGARSSGSASPPSEIEVDPVTGEPLPEELQ